MLDLAATGDMSQQCVRSTPPLPGLEQQATVGAADARIILPASFEQRAEPPAVRS